MGRHREYKLVKRWGQTCTLKSHLQLHNRDGGGGWGPGVMASSGEWISQGQSGTAWSGEAAPARTLSEADPSSSCPTRRSRKPVRSVSRHMRALGGRRGGCKGPEKTVKQGLCGVLAHALLGPKPLATESNILEFEDFLGFLAVLLFCQTGSCPRVGPVTPKSD